MYTHIYQRGANKASLCLLSTLGRRTHKNFFKIGEIAVLGLNTTEKNKSKIGLAHLLGDYF